MKVETTIEGTVHGLSADGAVALQETARLFQAARRSAFQAAGLGQTREEIEPALRQRFRLDARFARDALLEAQAVHKAMRELVPGYLADVQRKLAKTERRLEKYQSGQWKPHKKPLAEIVAGLRQRLDKLERKAKRWQAHAEADTTPPVIFGSARAFHARRRGQLSQAEWRALRRQQFWSRGEKSKGGNPHVTIVPQGDQFRIRLATLPQQHGRLGNVAAELWLSPRGQRILAQGLAGPVSVRVLQEGRRWRLHLTVHEQVSGQLLSEAPAGCRVGGLDCNTDRICAALISPEGNLLGKRTFWLRDVPDMRRRKAVWHISQALNAALAWLEEQQASAVVLEALAFAQDHDTNRRYNRATTRFRSTMVKLAQRKALRRGFGVIEVNPAYTSIIGKYKYAKPYGLSVHEAAAFVIARRGQKRDEALPKAIVGQFAPLRSALWTATKTASDPAQRRRFAAWAQKLADWKHLHSWSFPAIGEGGHTLLDKSA